MNTQVSAVWLCAIIYTTSVHPAIADEKAQALLQQVEVTLRHTKTLAADFSRTYIDGTVRSGTLRLMKPNFARIEWKDPQPGAAPLYIASDGKMLWRYDYSSKKEFTVGKADPTGAEFLLWGDGAPVQSFFRLHSALAPETLKAMKFAGRQQWDGAEYQVLEETSDGNGDPDRGYTRQWFVGKDRLIHRYLCVLHHHRKNGSMVQYELAIRNIQIDIAMTASSFAYTPPTDAKRVGQATKPLEPPLLANGTAAPDFTVRGKDGKPIKLSDYRGKVVVLDFWATWCGPCMQSLPRTAAMASKYAVKNVVVLAVNVWDTQTAFDSWISAHPQYAALSFATDTTGAPNDVATALYKVSGIPTQYIIDPNGIVVANVVGYEEAGCALEDAINKACKVEK